MFTGRAGRTKYTKTKRIGFRRRAMVTIRDTWLLFREFRLVLLGFIIILILSASSFYFLWNFTTDLEPIRGIDALYFVITLIFFEPAIDFPAQWYLEVYFFVMPIIGVVFLTLGVADFSIALFNRHVRLNQWEASLASTYRHHVILIGLGHIGRRVMHELLQLGEDVVAVELNPERAEQLAEARRVGVPVIFGDARTEETLEQAGINYAASTIICTDNDLTNIQIASRIREHHKDIRIVMRLFDDEFSSIISQRFNIDAIISSSALSAPVFAGAATGTEVMQTFKVEDQILAMGRIEVQMGAKLVGKTIQYVEDALDISVVLLHEVGGDIDVRPEPDYVIGIGDVIAVVAEIEKVRSANADWNRARSGLMESSRWWQFTR